MTNENGKDVPSGKPSGPDKQEEQQPQSETDDSRRLSLTTRDHDVPSDDDDFLEEAKSDGSDPGVVMVTPSVSPRNRDRRGGWRRKNDDDDDGVPTALALDAGNNNNNDERGTDDEEGDDEHFEDSILAPDIPQPPSFIRVGLDRKASPWTLKSWVALSLTLDGRDKITKLLQYGSRFLAWWFVAYGLRRRGVNNGAAAALFNKNQSVRFTSLYKAVAESRKAFRLGRSITELHKITTMGLWGLLSWHFHRHMVEKMHLVDSNKNNDDKDAQGVASDGEHYKIDEQRRSTSDIELSPVVEANAGDIVKETSTSLRTLYRTGCNILYQKIYGPVLSRLVSLTASISGGTAPKVELWEETGTILKMVGLMGFWLGDNVNFLTSTGALDDYSQKLDKRLERRKRWQTVASEKANQAYFFGAVAGLFTSAYAYIRFKKDQLDEAKRDYQRTMMNSLDTESAPEREDAVRRLKKVQEKQFTLFLALLKSCVDVAVFSNNPGIDWHLKLRGRKNNEGIHCLCGLISAGTVLYNNFPDASSTKSSKTSMNNTE